MDANPRGQGRDWAGRFGEVLRDVVLERVTRPKYGDAVQVALDVVSTRIHSLDERIESGAKVSSQDHYLQKKLRDLKTELEQAFEERWTSRTVE
jgi:hypothetical protein